MALNEVVKLSNLCFKRCTVMLLSVLAVIITLRYLISSHKFTDVTWMESDSSSVPEDVMSVIYFVEDNLETLDQTDSRLIQYALIRHLSSPSKSPYNLDGNGTFRDNFSDWVTKFFGNMTGGKFIEAGANKGDRNSHTLYLERELGWEGLLIECNPLVMPYLRSKHRKAWIADVCLSPTTNPGILNFSNPVEWTPSGRLGKPWNIPGLPTNWTYFDVKAIPLYTLIAAVGWKEIDYFSFDIEGQELSVLRNFPFHLVTFKVLIVETYFYSKQEKEELNKLLTSNGYVFVRDFNIDKIYVHESVKGMIPAGKS